MPNGEMGSPGKTSPAVAMPQYIAKFQSSLPSGVCNLAYMVGIPLGGASKHFVQCSLIRCVFLEQLSSICLTSHVDVRQISAPVCSQI